MGQVLLGLAFSAGPALAKGAEVKRSKAASGAGDSAGLSPGAKAKLDNYIRSFADTGLFSGVVLVMKGGNVVTEQAYGVAEKAFDVPMTTDTKFQIASLSKPITSAAVGILVDQGKLHYEDKLEQHVHGIPNGDCITIEQLLTHTSGLDSPDRFPGSGEWMQKHQTTEQLVARVRDVKPLFAPGERYEYANANYWLLAHIIEKLSGLGYGAFLKASIFDPVGMTNTAHRDDLLAVVPKLAPGYAPDGPGRLRVAEIVDWTAKTGNGSIYSTTRDLAKFFYALTGDRILKPETLRRTFGDGKPGFAWIRRDSKALGHASVRFNGRSPGYSSYLEGFVDDGVVFIILSNLYVYAPTVMSEGIAAIIWDRPFEPQQPIKVQPASAAQLRDVAGTYQFSADFFLRNGTAELAPAGDHIRMHWSAGGLVTTLLPTGPGSYFDPTFWATLKFFDRNGQKVMTYQAYGFPKIYEAPRVKQRP
jgi:CubicO group peptidase (beta-lactamase class C family)